MSRDVFSPVLGIEEGFASGGRKVGFADGRASGTRDARIFGAGKGFAVGEEVGFYLGAAAMCHCLKGLPRAKDVGAASAVFALADTIPLVTPPSQNCDIGERLDCLRAKFKVLRSLVGPRVIPELDNRQKLLAKQFAF